MSEEDYCRYCIHEIQRRAQEEMRPYIDRLVRLHSMAPPNFHITHTVDWSAPPEKPADPKVGG